MDQHHPLSTFQKTLKIPKTRKSINALSIYEDHNGTLWLGSVDDGLLRFTPNTQKFDHFIPDTGTAKYVNCVQEDADGYLLDGNSPLVWRALIRAVRYSHILTPVMVLKLVKEQIVSKTRKVKCSLEYFRACHLFPNQIIDNPNPPAVVITALNLNNKPLRTNLLSDEKIRLSFQENYLSFDFSALDFTNPAKNLYAYKMEGMDEVWTESGTRRHADYPDLKPGTYTFRVKASNNSGIWNEQGTAVKITITPPFWQTWWFIGLMGLMLAGFVVVGVRLRVKAIETRSLELEDQVRNRTAELEASVAQLTALQDTTKAMASTLELDKLLNLIVQQATTLLHADGGIINLVDEDNREDEIVAITGLIPPSVGLRTPLDASLSGWVTLHNQPIISNQIPSDNRIARSTLSWVRDHNIQSAAAAPLTVRDQVKGSLIVVGQKEGKREFVKSDLDLLVAFANQAAIAIENASLYSQSKELAVHEERSRLARELHDAVTQTLFSASLVAEALPASWEKDPDEGRGLLQELRGLCRGALAEMRSLLLELRPAALMETHIGDLLRQLGEAASGRAGIPIQVQVDKQVKLPPDVQIAFYRITQETLNNVVKHARAHQVNVDLCYTSTGTDLTQSLGRSFS